MIKYLENFKTLISEEVTGFVPSMECLEKYGIQLSVFRGHE